MSPTCRGLWWLQPSAVTVATSPWIMGREIPGHVASVVLWTLRHMKVHHHRRQLLAIYMPSPPDLLAQLDL